MNLNKNDFYDIDELDLIDSSFANFLCNRYDKKMVEAVFRKHKILFLKKCKIALGESQNVNIQYDADVSKSIETMFDFLLVKNLHFTDKILIVDYPHQSGNIINRKEYNRKPPSSYCLNIPFHQSDINRPVNALFVKTFVESTNYEKVPYSFYLGEYIFEKNRCLCIYMMNNYTLGSFSIDNEYMNSFLIILQFLIEYIESYKMIYNKIPVLLLGFENEKTNINHFIKNLMNRNLTSTIIHIDKQTDVINNKNENIILMKQFLRN